MNPVEVMHRLEEAMRARARMPDEYRPHGHRSSWPDTLREAADVYARALAQGQWDRMSARNGYPDAETIDRMDEALGWLWWIEDGRVRTVVSARAVGARWTWIARDMGKARSTVRAWWLDGIAIIADRLTRNGL